MCCGPAVQPQRAKDKGERLRVKEKRRKNIGMMEHERPEEWKSGIME